MILVVDDNVDIREALTELLGEAGYDVRGARDGRDALVQLRNGERPKAILLDMAMPVMDGPTFRLEQLGDPGLADIPVIILSATVDCAEASLTLRAQGCLRKPVKPDQLLLELSRICASER